MCLHASFEFPVERLCLVERGDEACDKTRTKAEQHHRNDEGDEVGRTARKPGELQCEIVYGEQQSERPARPVKSSLPACDGRHS